jgi:hypothetical protein
MPSKPCLRFTNVPDETDIVVGMEYANCLDKGCSGPLGKYRIKKTRGKTLLDLLVQTTSPCGFIHKIKSLCPLS